MEGALTGLFRCGRKIKANKVGAKTPTRQTGSRFQKLRVLKEREERLAWIQRLGTSAAPALIRAWVKLGAGHCLLQSE